MLRRHFTARDVGVPSTKRVGGLSCSGVPSRPLPESSTKPPALLPERFQKWFVSRGWSPREHQLALLEKAREARSALLIAPTGAGKTLAGFLPSLVELSGSMQPPVSPPRAARA
ncbi:hypothetical protein, partial [Bradyrhizobium sp.]|uniref:hypothetical protein n=1 Tax=Bradyrhizobium sp. TaxID=376 RepID=UPI003C68CD27